MRTKLPPYVIRETTRHGRVTLYFRRGKGKRVRLPDDVISEEFNEAYLAALNDTPIPDKRKEAPSRSLRWLVDRYRESAHWRGYSNATRRQQELFFIQAIDRSGNADFSAVDRRAIMAAVEGRSDRPALANNFLKAMRALFAWAVINEHVQVNPTDGVASVRYKSDGFAAWTVDDYARFCERWPVGTKARLAVELLLHTGLRRSDIVRIGPQHMRENRISIRTAKTNSEITVELPDYVSAMIKDMGTGQLAFLVSESGGPFTKESFGNWFRNRCNDAGIEKSAHGIRKLAATLSAEGGAPAHELMAQFGWTNIRQAELYTKGADRRELGVRSSKRISDRLKNSK